MKYRVIESDNEIFYPQTRRGWLRRWRLFWHDADTSPFMLESLILTDDPANAAAFATAPEAEEFILRVQCKAAAYWAEKESTDLRSCCGVVVKRVIE